MTADIARVLVAAAAATAPTLLAYNVSPSPTFLNQALAVGLWGWFVVVSAHGLPATLRGAAPLLGALALVALGVLWAWGPGALPMGLALSALGLLAAAAVMVASGSGAHAQAAPASAFDAFCIGWVVAGVFNVALAAVQVFLPDWPDGRWIADSGIPGRAVGNLRQPNHLSSVLLWSALAVVALADGGRLGRRWAAALFAALVFAVVLTASRTGLVSVLLLALWGLADRRLARATRALLLAAPLVYAASWLGMAEWAKLTQATFGGAARLAEADVSGSRFGIWANTLALIRQQPWGGVGFGEFNFAWTLTPFPGRPVALFDHTHNLPLQLAVELGLPLATAVMALLLWALWRAAVLAFGREDGDEPGDDAALSRARRCAVMMVLMIGLHSLLEYPLWYAYFLLPATWAWAFAVGRRDGAAPSPARAAALSTATVAGGALLVMGSAASVADYWPVTRIFSAEVGGPPLAQRIARGQRSVLFAHHADYAAATTADGAQRDLKPFERATHYLLDTRLMIAWAQALHANGQEEQARYVVDRLREFRNPGAAEFLGACAASGPAASVPPFQCRAATLQPDWREFRSP